MKSHLERQLNVIHLGRVDYRDAWDMQQELAAARAEDHIPDTLLLLEHPHTYTFGRSGRREHLLISEAECTRQGVALYDVDRGGDVTYHGPGQLVGYPILRLPDHGLDYHAYLRALETVIIRAVAAFGVTAGREPGYTGVWVASTAKIAAIGVKVDRHGITSHGFALNVNPDMGYFEGIVPCGIHERGITSLVEELGHPLPLRAVAQELVTAFAEVFGFSYFGKYRTSLVFATRYGEIKG